MAFLLKEGIQIISLRWFYLTFHCLDIVGRNETSFLDAFVLRTSNYS